MRNIVKLSFLTFALVLGCMTSAMAAKGFPFTSETGFYKVTFPVPPGNEESHRAKSSTHLSYAYSKISANFQSPNKSKKVRYRIAMEPIGEYVNANSLIVQKAEAYEQSMLKKKAGVDMVPYKNLKPKNKMKINITEQTTTFPVPVNKLKGRLMDNIGMTWETEHGSCIITTNSINWIMENVKTSMYNNDRSYVYNKAFARWFDNNNAYQTKTGGLAPTGPRSMDVYSPQKKYSHQRTLKMFDDIRDWAKTRGLYDKGNSHTQYVKLQEEAGELAKALLNNDGIEILDAIGDMVVVLTNLAHLEGFTIEQCIESAYDEISDRTGKMINGTFVKDAN